MSVFTSVKYRHPYRAIYLESKLYNARTLTLLMLRLTVTHLCTKNVAKGRNRAMRIVLSIECGEMPSFPRLKRHPSILILPSQNFVVTYPNAKIVKPKLRTL